MSKHYDATVTEAMVRVLVRETGYNAVRLKANNQLGEDYSRAISMYKIARLLLYHVSPLNASAFIEATYNPLEENI